MVEVLSKQRALATGTDTQNADGNQLFVNRDESGVEHSVLTVLKGPKSCVVKIDIESRSILSYGALNENVLKKIFR